MDITAVNSEHSFIQDIFGLCVLLASCKLIKRYLLKPNVIIFIIINIRSTTAHSESRILRSHSRKKLALCYIPVTEVSCDLSHPQPETDCSVSLLFPLTRGIHELKVKSHHNVLVLKGNNKLEHN